MRHIKILSFVVAFLLAANLSFAADGGDKPANYLAVKGGIYSPSNEFKLRNLPGSSTTSDLDSKIGFDGEVALGHYFMPAFAMEIGAGYFQSKGSGTLIAPDAKLRVVPVQITAKLLLPLGPLEPYALGGVGGYFSKITRDEPAADLSTKAIFGLHAGAGINFNVTNAFFIGFEGKYIWTERDDWGTSDVKLDGFTTTADLGFRF